MESNTTELGIANDLTITQVLQALIDTGMRDFCISPGGRNAPLLAHIKLIPQLRSLYFYDERSAAFFALGLIQSTNRPVAVITTSGTAIAHLLPAAMEAYYKGIPLVLLTADRPRRFRGSNAPQTAEQVGIFGQYAPSALDIAGTENCDLREWDRRSPLHINICLEEPNQLPLPEQSQLIVRQSPVPTFSADLDNVSRSLNLFLESAANPFVVVGGLPADARESVVQFLLKLKAPVYLEAISGIREDPRLESIAIRRSDRLWNAAEAAHYPIDSIIRIGGIPTFRLWRDIEEREGKIKVFSINDVPFSGLSWGTISPVPLYEFFQHHQVKQHKNNDHAAEWLKSDRIYCSRLLDLIESEPTSETGLIHALSKKIPQRARIFLGNSLPIREWDLAATWQNRHYDLYATRGLNGIDGQTSTFYGMCVQNRSNWGILGDLTALHDMSAPWILSHLPDLSANLVIINNGGGKIFERIFKQKELQNCHHVHFEPLAQMWGLDYQKWFRIPEELGEDGQRIIEIIPDNDASQRFWKGAAQL